VSKLLELLTKLLELLTRLLELVTKLLKLMTYFLSCASQFRSRAGIFPILRPFPALPLKSPGIGVDGWIVAARGRTNPSGDDRNG
jgi:hypothetical protein